MMLTTNAKQIVEPAEAAALLLPPVQSASVALQVAQNIRTHSPEFRIPIVASDPVAHWVAEGEEITPSDMQLRETVATMHKLAGLTIVTNELRNDSSPEATQAVGDGLARDIARKLDAAFFGALDAPAPQGLESLAGVTKINGALSTLDPFLEAISAAEVNGATLTTFVANPADVLTLGKVKKASGSNEPLLQPDASRPTGRIIAGVPILSSTAVPVGTIWGIPQAFTYAVIHEGIEIEIDASVFFTSDRSAVRAKMRAGFAFPHEPAIVKINTAA